MQRIFPNTLEISPGIKVAGCLYLPLGKEREAIPDTSHHHLPAEPLQALRYLAKFSVEAYCPYTERQEKAFQESFEADLITRRWLQVGLFVTTLLTIIAALPVVVEDYDLQRLSQAAVIVVVVIGVANNLISFIATGTNPHYASCVANEAQDATQEAIDFYREQLVPTLQSLELVEAKAIAQGLTTSREQLTTALTSSHPKITPYQKERMLGALYKVVATIQAAELPV